MRRTIYWLKGSDSKCALSFLLLSAFGCAHYFRLSVVSPTCALPAPKQAGFGGTFHGRVTEADACLLRLVLVALVLIEELKSLIHD